jgi:hypothetical protein
MVGFLIIRDEKNNFKVSEIGKITKIVLAGIGCFDIHTAKGGRRLVLTATEYSSEETQINTALRREAYHTADKRLEDCASLRTEIKKKHKELERARDPAERSRILQEIDEWTQLIQQHMDTLNEKYYKHQFTLSAEFNKITTTKKIELHQNVRYQFDEVQLTWVHCPENKKPVVLSRTTTNTCTTRAEVLNQEQQDTITTFFDEQLI